MNIELSNTFKEAARKLEKRGAFFLEEANQKGFALVEIKEGNIKLFLLIEPESRTIEAARYFSYGGMKSLGVAEALCVMLEAKRVDEAFKLTGDDVEATLRDEPDTPAGDLALFQQVRPLMLKALEALPDALTVAEAAAALRDKVDPVADGSAWMALSVAERIGQVEKALDGPIRDYIRAEGGHIDVLDVVDGVEVKVEFSGSCGSCAGSTSTTLYGIEDTLRRQLYPRIRVVVENAYI